MRTKTFESIAVCFFFFSSRRRHTRLQGDWSSDVCSSDLACPDHGVSLPRPVQRGHAPWGELKEKMRGWSSGSETPWSGQANFSLKVSSAPSRSEERRVGKECRGRWGRVRAKVRGADGRDV